MAELAKLMDSVVRVAPYAVVIVDMEGVIQFCNPALNAMFGYDEGVLIGQQLEVLLPDDLRTMHILHRQGYARAPETRPMGGKKVLRGRRKNSQLFPIEVGLSSTSLEGQTFYFASIVDVTDRWLHATELEKHRESLQQQVMDRTEDIGIALRTSEANSQFMSRLLEMVNHEFRTPLSSIIGYGELLEMHLTEMGAGQEAAIKYAQSVKEAGQDLLEIVRKVANLSLVNMGELEAAALPVAVDRAVSDAVERIDRVLTRQKIKVATEWHDPVVPLADPTMFVRALAMILENAALYGAPEETIVVAIRKSGDDLCELAIANSGMGLSASERHAALKPFERLEQALGTTSGIGLGLTIVKAYVHAMGGKLELRRGETSGMVASIMLPCTEPD